METIERLKQLLLVYRTEDIRKLTFEERIEYDNAFAQEIVKLFPPADAKPLLCVCADLFSRNLIWNTNRKP